MPEKIKLIEPATLLKISKIHLRAKYVVEGLVSGLHRSPLKGHSLEFTQHREYTPLDEPKHIDWKVYGRTDKFFVKQYEEETNLRAYILLDASGSMSFKSAGETDKLTYAANLAAAIAYILIHQEDSTGLVAFDTSIKKFLPARAQSEQFTSIFHTLETLMPGGETSISGIVSEFARLLKRRSLIIIISDLMDEPEEVLKSIKLFRYKHHDVIVFQIIDSAERNLPFKGPVIFESLEDKSNFYTEPDDIKFSYSALFEKFLNEYKRSFEASGIDYSLIPTDEPLEIALGAYLYSRKKA